MPDRAPDGPRIRLLGDFRAVSAEGTTLLGGGKPLAVVAYLLCSRTRRASRASIASLLWTDDPETRGLASLRQALATLRRTLGSDVVQSANEWIEAGTSPSCDVTTFERAVADHRYDDAVAAYAGDFIPHWAASGAGDFERWADGERGRLRGLFTKVTDALIRAQLRDHDVASALPLSKRLVDSAPDSDTAWCLRFDVLMMAGEGGQFAIESEALRAARATDGMPLSPVLAQTIDRYAAAQRPAVMTGVRK